MEYTNNCRPKCRWSPQQWSITIQHRQQLRSKSEPQCRKAVVLH